MADKTSISVFIFIIFLAISSTPSNSLEYPQELLNPYLFSQDLQPQSSTLSLPPSNDYFFYPLRFPFPYPSPSPFPENESSVVSGVVPGLFVIGDSSVDAGNNNNFLGTFARSDRLPYGRDFDTHLPTGRFSNGRIPVDFLGIPLVPNYLENAGSVEAMIHGVNYASAGAGIIFATGSDLGQRVSFAQQIQQLSDTFQQFKMNMGEDIAANLISKSILYISIGSNDYIHYYLLNVSGVQSVYSPWSFNRFLANTMKQQIKNLYSGEVRKVVIMGLGPMGCAPHYLWKYKSKNGECIDEINNMIMEFNFVMRFMVEQLNDELSDANIIFCDAYQGSMDIIENHKHYGFQVTSDACCGMGMYKGWIMCLSPEMACRNASTHIWWDQYHPTEAVNRILADNVWSGLHSSMCYPMNMKDMVILDSQTIE
ncbi:GDSL esterase/lipase At5g08460-like isoform X2 [Silene latifolia]|uniref:GDSL esterase/lipase At5g08460-like isoform X2 n=1 Tax=Silene latifolia TaxID=37657 RepID=UPI003D76F256